MSEKLIEIVNSIHLCEQDSKVKRIIPIARVHCVVNGNYDTYWFTNETISPRVLGILRSYGHFVPKNSSIAVKIQRNEVGSIIEYEGINQIKNCLVDFPISLAVVAHADKNFCYDAKGKWN